MFALLATVSTISFYPAPADEAQRSPLDIRFERFCSPTAEAGSGYEPRSSTYYIRFRSAQFEAIGQESAFEVTRVSRCLPQSLSFQLSGIPEQARNRIILSFGDDQYSLDPKRHDRKLFVVEQRGNAIQIAFTEKGLALLQPGTRISYVEQYW